MGQLKMHNQENEGPGKWTKLQGWKMDEQIVRLLLCRHNGKTNDDDGADRSYLESACHDSVNGGIQCSKFHLPLQLGGSGRPLRSETLAVAAPRSKELHQPQVITPKHQLLKVAVCQLNHVLWITALNTSHHTL